MNNSQAGTGLGYLWMVYDVQSELDAYLECRDRQLPAFGSKGT